MENTKTMAKTIAYPGSTISTPGSTSGFAMSPRGCTFATNADPSATIRERKVSAKAHVGFVAHTTGTRAWSPPLC